MSHMFSHFSGFGQIKHQYQSLLALFLSDAGSLFGFDRHAITSTGITCLLDKAKGRVCIDLP
jgi:hypothetical protein